MDEHRNNIGDGAQVSPTHSPKQTWISDEAGIVCEGGGLVASTGLPEAYWERGGGDPTLAEVEAMERHAHLIAAAPELYEALDHPLLLEVLGFVEDAAPDEVMAKLRLWQDEQRAALSKARPSNRGEA